MPAQARPWFQESERVVGSSASLAANCWISVLTRQGPLWALWAQISTLLSWPRPKD